MRITFVTRKCGNVERNSHCDVLHITPVRVTILVLDCNGVFAIKVYRPTFRFTLDCNGVFAINAFVAIALASNGAVCSATSAGLRAP